jgi:hypothetical protein
MPCEADHSQTLREQNTSLAESNRELSSIAEAHPALQTQHSEITAQLEAANNRIQTQESTISSLQSSSSNSDVSSPSTDTTTRIQSLETALQASTLRVQTLSRELADLHSAYIQAQKERDDALSSTSTFSPRAARGQGLFLSPSEESPRRAPLGRTASGGLVDSILPASVRHKRQVSLNALKARMEPRDVKKMGVVGEEDEEGREGGSETNTPGIGGKRAMTTRSQFGDEIVFCCPACEGDLFEI